ncbi:MAG: DUF4365 domain-containing protein [Oceanospirillaceae bacterium]
MTKRIKQHQLEDLSRYKFALSIPQKWVFRDKDKDYGIDGEVETFNSEEKATGLVFWVQLKATSSDQARTIRGFDLSLETIKYYKRLEIPVLIARYSEHEDRFYVKWSGEIDTFYAKDDAKTMRVSFSEAHILDEEKYEELNIYLAKLRAAKSGAIKLPIDVKISFKSKSICGVASSILISRIRSEIHNFSSVMRLVSCDKSLTADVCIDENTLKVGFIDIAGCTFHSVDLMDPSTLAEDLLKDISLALSLAVSQLGYSDLAARIIFSHDLQHRLKVKSEVFEYLLPCLLKSNYFKETLEIVSGVCDETEHNFLEMITNSALLFIRNTVDKEKQKATETFLKNTIERYKEKSPSLYGISQYNLGNFYRNTDRSGQAARCLLIARRYESNYYNQGYFYKELADSLFDIGKFTFASKLYNKALEIDSCEDILPLYADSLMFSGKYQEAHETFERYLKKTNSQHAGWHLKSICLASIIKNHDIKAQYRNIKNAVELADICSLSLDEAEKGLDKALEKDLLCGLAWFNLAHLKNSSGQIRDAAFCYTMCALVQTGDIEAWVKATACSFNNIVPIEIFALLVRTGYFFNGERYIEALYKVIEGSLGEDALSQIAHAIDQLLLDDRKSKSNIPELRILNEEGKFENVLVSESG